MSPQTSHVKCGQVLRRFVREAGEFRSYERMLNDRTREVGSKPVDSVGGDYFGRTVRRDSRSAGC